MFSAIRGGARLVRRATVPAAVFGGGYACSWSQQRDESAQQLLAYATARTWTGASSGLRYLATSAQGVCPPDFLSKAETVELGVLFQMLAKFKEQGVDSSLLRRLAVRRLCECAAEDPRAPSILSLVGEDGQLSGVIALIDANAVALDADSTGAEESLLAPITKFLTSLAGTSKSKLDEELGTTGVLQMKRLTLLMTKWLAESQRTQESLLGVEKMARRPSMNPHPEIAIAFTDAEDDLDMIINRLQSSWEVLAQPAAKKALRDAKKFGAKPEIAELNRDIERRMAELKSSPPSLPQPRALEDYLPKRVRTALFASGKDGASKGGGSQAKKGGFFKTIGKAVELTSWLVLIGAGAVMLSEDGFAVLPFHAVPELYRPAVHKFSEGISNRLEGLLGKHDSVQEPPAGPR